MSNLSETQRFKTIHFLGYPSKIIDKNSTLYNSIVAGSLEDLSQEAIDEVEGLITLIAETKVRLDESQSTAHVNRIGDIGLTSGEVVENISRQFSRYKRELSALCNIPIAPGSGTNTVSIYT